MSSWLIGFLFKKKQVMGIGIAFCLFSSSDKKQVVAYIAKYQAIKYQIVSVNADVSATPPVKPSKLMNVFSKFTVLVLN